MLGVLMMLVPLVAAVVVMFAPARAARGVALIGTLVVFGIALVLGRPLDRTSDSAAGASRG